MSIQRLIDKCRYLEEKEKWKDLSETYDHLGRMFSEKGKFKEALKYHTKDKEVCEMVQDISGQAQAHRMMGEVLADLAKYSEALEQQKQYLAMSRQLQDPVMEQRALATLGRTYLYMAETDPESYGKSIKYFEKAKQAINRCRGIDTKERASMMGRALENIGLVSWHLGQREESEASLYRAELSYRDYKLWDDLFRLFDSIVSLRLGSGTSSDLSSALKYCEKSLDAANKVHSARQKQCLVAALFTKSKVHLLREEWEDARDCLIRARGYGTDSSITPMLNNNLKMMIVLVRGKERIEARVGEELMSHTVYEEIADALTKFQGNPAEYVKVLEVAVKYYKLAYSRADNDGNSEALPPLNNSIALTYKDLGDFDNALVFFERQLDLEKGKYGELGDTYSNIASVRESLKCSFQQVLQPLLEWEQCAVKTNSVSAQLMALQEIERIEQLAGREEEAREAKEKMRRLGGGLDADLPSSQGSGVSDQSDNFPDVDLDLVEVSSVRRVEARRTLAVFKKINAKGEYPLHVKLQKSDNESEILSLIERGHPLEVEDHCGWTPLGEAVGQMNISYIKILVKAGANINHRNITLKDSTGDTPLLSACARGFLDGIEFLMSKGAKVDLRNKKGESCLSWLQYHVKEGKKGKCKDYKMPGVMDRLEAALTRVEAEYSRLGLTIDYNLPSDSDSMDSMELGDESDSELDQTIRNTSRRESGGITTSTQIHNTGQARRNVSRSPSPDYARSFLAQTLPAARGASPSPPPSQFRRAYSHSRSPSPVTTRPISPVSVAPTQAYKDAIAGVRSHTKSALQPLTQVQRRSKVSHQQGELDEGYDWLEDDMGPEKKKRKRPSENISNDKKKVKSLQSRRENLSPTPSVSIDLTNSPDLKPPQKALTSKLSKTKKTLQPKIYNSLPPAPRPVSPSYPSSPSPVPDIPPSQHTLLPTARVKVKVVGEMFLIPVPNPETTVAWLAGEASARYYRQNGSEPVVRLTTGDGAGLDPGDLVTHVVQGTEPLHAVVTSWNCKPAEERYRDSCKDHSTPCFKNICDRLSLMATTNTLSISVPMKKQHAAPIFHCLKSNIGLRELHLSRCKLADPSITLLVQLLPTLANLSSLDLSQNLISLQSLKLLSCLKLPSISNISLSGNPLGDLSLPSLTSLLSMGPIISLNLSRCMFTKSLFQTGRPDFAEAMKKSLLKSFDISHNNFGEVGVEILLKSLPETLTSLSLSACTNSATSQGLGTSLFSFCSLGNPTCQLTCLDLSAMCITDNTLDSILQIFFHCGSLSSLSLSNNPITASGLVSLIKSLVEESVPLTILNCSQLKAVSKNFWSDKSVLPYLEDQLESLLASNCSRLEYFALPDHTELVVSLKKVWDKAWGSRSRHNRDGVGNVLFSVSC